MTDSATAPATAPATDSPAGRAAGLTVAVTGLTGTFGAGLVPLLETDDRVARVLGVARRPFDPATRGWSKMAYHRADVTDLAALSTAVAGADVVVHLAFLVTGTAPRERLRAVNVTGTLNAFRAAVTAGARRFVYASSVAAYGFAADNPQPLTEADPVRPAARLFYAREKAELEERLTAEAAAHPGVDLYLLRPSLVVGPHAVGGKELLPGPLGRLLAEQLTRRLPVPLPVAVPAVPLQLVHEDDVGAALLACVLAAGPPGAYNIAGDGVLTLADVAREYGALTVPLPAGPARLAARAAARLPFLPPAAEWVEALSSPVLMDTAKAREQLGWRPRYSGLEALRATLR